MKRDKTKKSGNTGPTKPRKVNPYKRIEKCTKWIEECPQNATAYFERARYKYELGDWEGTLSDYNAGLLIRPDDESALNSRGIVKSDMGDQLGAIEDYDKLIALNPEHREVWNNRGIANFESGNVQEAILDYRSEEHTSELQ